jgi:HD-GYP domain-containing protein (c-di-GMP phosphodiesterase class II)
MTSERPYRRALHREEAIEELGQGRGSQFDPAIVDEFFFVLSSTAGRGVGDGS